MNTRKILRTLLKIMLIFIKIAISLVSGYIFYFLIGFSLDKISEMLAEGFLKNIIEHILVIIGPFGFGLPLIFIFGLIIFVFWVRKKPSL
jgi:hypothetical protein